MVAALYDASLDAYLPHHWMQKFNVFRQDHSNLQLQFENMAAAAAAPPRAVARAAQARATARYRGVPGTTSR